MNGKGLLYLAIACLVLTTAYSQHGWRSDRRVFSTLRRNYDKLLDQNAFLASGDLISDQELRLLHGRDTTLLAAVVAGKNSVIYIEQRGCPFCDWFEGEMNRRLPSWKDSIMVISLTSHSDSIRGAYGVPEYVRRTVPGTPVLFVVDSTGLIVSSALGAKRVLNVLNSIGFPSPSFQQMIQAGRQDP